jgi:predicted alpha/beta hydrolase family esterase
MGIHISDKTLFVAGTRWTPQHIGHDLLDDMTRVVPIPGWSRGIRDSHRYKQIAKVIRQHKPTTIVGHSLAGAVAKQAARDFGLRYRSYAAPALTFGNDPNSFRTQWDPIAITNRSAQVLPTRSWNVHSIDNIPT